MKFTPMTDEEIDKAGLMQLGEYDFEVMEAEEYTKDNGNVVTKLKLNVFDESGKGNSVLDWITPSFMKKFKHFFYAVGLQDSYETGQTDPTEYVGKSGKLKLGIGKPYVDGNGITRTNNSVDDYIKRDANAPKAASKSVADDEIPF